ncbi:MAG: mannose-1-phosphate guanylyltransferase/mannose-6-phosphate isomerase [Desulfuromonadaceae bacterium]|nr:mannose-1-phosphate guanylyltransferase/mannose-6-phosphate isomerase [Desulfuromonadaceae bacterium]
MLYPVILSGGSGTRLWPLSRSLHPKQLLPLTGDLTLLQQTVSRLTGLEDVAAPLIVCNESHRFMVAEQLRQIGIVAPSILLEPVGRNTAPAVALSALHAHETDPEAVLLVLPADHVIARPAVMRRAVQDLLPWVERGKLATFGVVPTGAETGYGYIRRDPTAVDSASGIYPVAAFVEKPDISTAQQYVDSGAYYWNSGMFLFRADRYLEQLQQHAPAILASCRAAMAGAQCDLDFVRVDAGSFESCPGDSIDYAVMEKTAEAVVIPLDAGWNDVGSWSALWEVGDKDGQNNVVKGDVLLHDVKNSYLHSSSRLLAAVGVDDLVVVETADAVLVAKQERVQDVKAIVDQLGQQQRSETDLHSRVARPWGCYQTIDQEERFQVKRITVKPGASLSLQMHHHRAEHWIIVRGTARITKGDEVLILSENESTYIPLGVSHRLENPGLIPLELIEVQSGAYLGEDDIVRFEDRYGR